ncbi:MAG: 50S ribosomal protein L30 [Chloroflexia bacterium]
MTAKKKKAKRLRITWVKSTIGHPRDQRATIRALGLHRLHESVLHDDTPVIRGMVFKVRHLVQVEEVEA